MIYVILLNGNGYLFPDFYTLTKVINNLSEIDKYYDMLTDINTAEYVINNFID